MLYLKNTHTRILHPEFFFLQALERIEDSDFLFSISTGVDGIQGRTNAFSRLGPTPFFALRVVDELHASRVGIRAVVRIAPPVLAAFHCVATHNMMPVGIGIGIIRILLGWPLHYLIISGYVIVILMTLIAPKEIVGIAYDSGGVTTSTITVPLVTALGVGLATSIRGRNPMVDGFGMIAFASLFPMIFVMGFGMILFGFRIGW